MNLEDIRCPHCGVVIGRTGYAPGPDLEHSIHLAQRGHMCPPSTRLKGENSVSAQGTEKAQKSQQARGGQVKNYDGSKTLAQLTEQAVKDGTELGQQMNAGTVKGSVTEKPAKPLLADKNARVRRFIDQLRGKQIVATKVEGKKGAWDIDTGGDTSVQAWLDREAALEGGAKVTKKVGKGHYTVDLELAPAKVGHQPPSKPEKPATA